MGQIDVLNIIIFVLALNISKRKKPLEMKLNEIK